MIEQNKILAIDISDNTIEIVESSFVNGEVKILSMNRVLLKAGIVENGEIKNADELKKEILILLSEAKPKAISESEAIFSLPDNLIYSHLFELKNDDASNFDLEAEANKVIPINQKNRLLTSKEFSLNNKKYYLALATSKQAVKKWQDFFTSININLSKIEFAPVAAYHGIEHSQQDKTTCLLDIGANTVSVSFFNESGLIYFFNLFQAGSAITKKIALDQKITIAKAEALKLNTDINNKDNKVSEIISSSFSDIFSELEKNINYLQGVFCVPIERVIIMGGQAKQKGMSEYLKNLKFTAPLALPKPLLIENEKLEYINAIGLSILANEQEVNVKERIKLFSKSEQKHRSSKELIEKISYIKAQFKKNKRVVILLTIFVCLIIGGITALSFKNNENQDYNQVNVLYPHHIKLPLILDINVSQENEFGARIVKVKIEKANELEKVLIQGKKLAEAELKPGEILWENSLSLVNENNLVFPLYLEWLIYNENKVKGAIMKETAQMMFETGYIFEDMKIQSLEIDKTENNNYKIYAFANIHSGLTLEEISAQKEKQAQKEALKKEMIKVKDLGVNLNVRQGPGITFPVVGQVLSLGLYEYIGEKDGWYQINLNKNVSGWVLGSLVEKL